MSLISWNYNFCKILNKIIKINPIRVFFVRINIDTRISKLIRIFLRRKVELFMDEQAILNQFLQSTQMNEDDVIDYTHYSETNSGEYISNAISIRIKGIATPILFVGYDIHELLNDLHYTRGRSTDLDKGFHEALDIVQGFTYQNVFHKEIEK